MNHKANLVLRVKTLSGSVVLRSNPGQRRLLRSNFFETLFKTVQGGSEYHRGIELTLEKFKVGVANLR